MSRTTCTRTTRIQTAHAAAAAVPGVSTVRVREVDGTIRVLYFGEDTARAEVLYVVSLATPAGYLVEVARVEDAEVTRLRSLGWGKERGVYALGAPDLPLVTMLAAEWLSLDLGPDSRTESLR